MVAASCGPVCHMKSKSGCSPKPRRATRTNGTNSPASQSLRVWLKGSSGQQAMQLSPSIRLVDLRIVRMVSIPVITGSRQQCSQKSLEERNGPWGQQRMKHMPPRKMRPAVSRELRTTAWRMQALHSAGANATQTEICLPKTMARTARLPGRPYLGPLNVGFSTFPGPA